MDEKTFLLLVKSVKLNSLKFKAIEMAMQRSNSRLYEEYSTLFEKYREEESDTLKKLQDEIDAISEQ